MRDLLLRWIGGADALQHAQQLRASQLPLAYAYQLERQGDLFLSLVGELFDCARDANSTADDWALLGNALAQFSSPHRSAELGAIGVSASDAALFSASAFYAGGYPASAYVVLRPHVDSLQQDSSRACCDLLTRPRTPGSRMGQDLLQYLVDGDLASIEGTAADVEAASEAALSLGPEEWIPLRLLQVLLTSFRRTNLRSVLPNGNSDFWNPLVSSMVRRGIWDFFPSQAEAIDRGLLARRDTFSLQMPTGAGKTALCEALLYSHLASDRNAAAVLLVPLRSLASELRSTIVRRLNAMGISSRCAYGGTVPTGTESRDFDTTQALVATPETLSGILSAAPEFSSRVSLVICDEGHLLDAPSRGIGLELLLARFRSRGENAPRFVFISAIVPNIEEMNAWLGGTDDSVVRSDYRPAIAEFAVLGATGSGVNTVCHLEMHPHEPEPLNYRLDGFLRRSDFTYINPDTGRRKTYPFGTGKTRAIAACRKALSLGSAVVFAANKTGKQGAEGLAEELISQLSCRLPLPTPRAFSAEESLALASEYLCQEYGSDWIGTRTLGTGVVLHHGDIPQETREVLERLLREGDSRMAICTNTLAEGVNLPIRSLVLYSVQRRLLNGRFEDLLTRDIKNLVGRAGRAGSTTRGLVICTNPNQWPMVRQVAEQSPGEDVVGGLRSLLERLAEELTRHSLQLTNELLERNTEVHGLVDGLDATLVDLAAIEAGEERFREMALALAEQTLAYAHTSDDGRSLLEQVIRLRSDRILSIRSAGRLEWARSTGARPRMIELVESELLPAYAHWHDQTDPLDPELVRAMVDWTWSQPEVQQAVRRYYGIERGAPLSGAQESFLQALAGWLHGASHREIAEMAGRDISRWLAVYTGVLTYAVQTVVEQGLAILAQLLASTGQELAAAVQAFPDHLRYGVPTNPGLALAGAGVRHRKAYVAIGTAFTGMLLEGVQVRELAMAADERLQDEEERWRQVLGELVYHNTRNDLTGIANRPV
jgi:helicase